MRKIFSVWIFILIFTCVAFVGASCGKETAPYALQACKERVVNAKKRDYETYGLAEQEKRYSKSYSLSEGSTCYFEEGLTDEKINASIECLERVRQVVEEMNVSFEINNVYVAQTNTTYFWEEDLWVRAEDCAEQILAVLLSEQDNGEYPFGVYAGEAAYFLKKYELGSIPLCEKSLFDELSADALHYRDLQYPLYWKEYTEEKEFLLAWTFSYELLSEFYRLYGEEGRLEGRKALMEEYIRDNSNVFNLEYEFVVNDSYYPIRIKTPNVTYYFTRTFQDVVFTEEEFSLTYSSLKFLLEDTERFIGEVRGAFGRSAALPERIEAYFGEELLTASDGHGGQLLGISYPSPRHTICRSLAAFTHELAHQILYFETDKAYFKEELCDLFANKTVWKRYYFFYLYTGKYRLAAEYDDADAVYKEAERLYLQKGNGVDKETFSAEEWESSLAVAANRREENFVLNCQTNSFVRYLYEKYGMNELDKLCQSLSATVEGKDFEALRQEWRNALEEEFNGI